MNYRRLGFCRRCNQMTNHWYMDATPKEGEYTVECCKCGFRPIQAVEHNAVWENVAIEENLVREIHNEDGSVYSES